MASCQRIISLDIGSGFVKACSSEGRRVRFPSLYAYREKEPWEKISKKGATTIVDGVGFDAIEIAKHPSAVIQRAVREGIPSNKLAFTAVLNEAIKRLNKQQLQSSCSSLSSANNTIHDTVIIIGLPYHAAKEAVRFPIFVEKISGCKRAIVVPQAIGTLVFSKRLSGIVLAIGHGTTELVVFDNMKTILGRSIPQACDFVYLNNNSSYENSNINEFQDDVMIHNNNHSLSNPSTAKTKQQIINQKRIEMLADIISENISSTKANLIGKTDYEIIVSGGGILLPGFRKLLQRKISEPLHLVEDPVFANASGMLEYAKNAIVT